MSIFLRESTFDFHFSTIFLYPLLFHREDTTIMLHLRIIFSYLLAFAVSQNRPCFFFVFSDLSTQLFVTEEKKLQQRTTATNSKTLLFFQINYINKYIYIILNIII